jgi:hypothetical protein
MKKLSALIFVIGLGISFNANAWFFFFLPGSATRAIGDAVTGAKGNICVKDTYKEGDIITSPNTGDTAKILSLSGTSSMCNNPATPIRAELEFNFTFSPKAGVELSDDYEPVPITDLERFNGYVLRAKSKTQNNQGIQMVSYQRKPTLEITQMANNIEAKGTTNPSLKDAVSKNSEKTVINGMPAIRFEITGMLKGLFGSQVTYLYTILQGDNEILVINTYAPTDKYDAVKQSFYEVAEKIVGINSAPQDIKQASSNSASKDDMAIAKTKCLNLGFKAGTESYGQCILKLSK